ncbi:uncharacterized protein LOC112629751 [Theropithecus gelada]|uniref:uncharacterized protein LOC112629751 n=1 Tax=Theropithecus gelada TaxID=9565 RepID=UPI000DC1A25E|nr:uncharacterized protein LOC112629751 [Theropithecus gelada]
MLEPSAKCSWQEGKYPRRGRPGDPDFRPAGGGGRGRWGALQVRSTGNPEMSGPLRGLLSPAPSLPPRALSGQQGGGETGVGGWTERRRIWGGGWGRVWRRGWDDTGVLRGGAGRNAKRPGQVGVRRWGRQERGCGRGRLGFSGAGVVAAGRGDGECSHGVAARERERLG